LSLLVTACFHFFQSSMAVKTLPDWMNLNVIWMLHCFQGIPAVPWLTSAFLLVTFAKALGGWLLVPIAGWWFAAVMAILCQLIFKRLYPLYELKDRLVHAVK